MVIYSEAWEKNFIQFVYSSEHRIRVKHALCVAAGSMQTHTDRAGQEAGYSASNPLMLSDSGMTSGTSLHLHALQSVICKLQIIEHTLPMSSDCYGNT